MIAFGNQGIIQIKHPSIFLPQKISGSKATLQFMKSTRWLSINFHSFYVRLKYFAEFGPHIHYK